MKTLSVSTISGAAIGRWPYILSALGIKVPSAGHHGACPACGGKDRFRLDDKAGRGTWFCNQCGHGDGLDRS
ncbi:primase-helicase zinc-binding domain-containing protein, partial [Salmonella enterica]|uniref:primase-helicase zinc-binding domain-containing protein n=1 Tax=Salmonella enterica TaxID=28901 RepID=UPI00112F531C